MASTSTPSSSSTNGDVAAVAAAAGDVADVKGTVFADPSDFSVKHPLQAKSEKQTERHKEREEKEQKMIFLFVIFLSFFLSFVLTLLSARRWTLWFDNPPKKASKENWGEALKPLASFDTIEDFWAYVVVYALYAMLSLMSHSTHSMGIALVFTTMCDRRVLSLRAATSTCSAMAFDPSGRILPTTTVASG
jgi:hypothetical protein